MSEIGTEMILKFPPHARAGDKYEDDDGNVYRFDGVMWWREGDGENEFVILPPQQDGESHDEYHQRLIDDGYIVDDRIGSEGAFVMTAILAAFCIFVVAAITLLVRSLI